MYKLYLFTENPSLKSLYVEKMNSQSHYHSNDAGIDLYVPETIIVGRGDDAASQMTGTVLFLDHQVICRMTKAKENGEEVPVSYYLYPRSSISKTPFRLANSVGIIDAGYRGNIIAALDYIRGYDFADKSSRHDYTLEKGHRIVQICAPTLEPIHIHVCDTKEEMDMKTYRSSGGFGSTGK